MLFAAVGLFGSSLFLFRCLLGCILLLVVALDVNHAAPNTGAFQLISVTQCIVDRVNPGLQLIVL
jgi:hypothetical protein